MTCETIGCDSRASWQVADQKRRKKVCRDCRDHLVVMGWHVTRSLFRELSW